MSDSEPRPTDLPREHESILPRDWAELAPLVDVVLDAAPEHRAALLVELAAGDPARQRALEHLVAECERDLPLLNRGAAERFDALAREPDASLLPELLAERYRTGRELGRGGMARVFLARDTKHGRDVAIKVIRAELSASLGHGRFLREIEIAARLRHPNIVPLYDSGEVGGSLYFVMPYEEGPSLRERLRQDGALPIADALSVLRDVARALAYAHDHGVVHRDVKPDNVMLSGDAAVVTDFGIAKAVSAALTDAGAEPTLTQAGSGIGTPAYMAPEQAMGDPGTDHRADIYSFGCLAYEVFTGTTPFPEPTSHQVIAAHVSRVPRRVTELRAEVPHSIADLVAHCLAKLPDERPQRVRDVLGVLDGTTTHSGIRPSPVAPRSVRGTAVRLGAVAVALALLAFAGYRATRAPAPVTVVPIKVAVLPFGDFTNDSAAAFLTDGLPEDIAAALGRVEGIQIQSRSGSRMFSGQLGVDVTEAGHKLGADYVLTAVVRREGGNWIVSAEFSRASDAASLWSESFTIPPDQQAGAVTRLVSSLLPELRKQFPTSVGTAPVRSQTSNNEAYRLYLLGQEALNRRRQSVKESAELFQQAINADTGFAAAYSGLSMSLALFPYFQGARASEVLPDLESAARRALDLDPSLAPPHVAIGMAHWYRYEWDSAGMEFEKAIRLDPRDVEARVQYARHLRFLGWHAESMRELQVARAKDPASALVLSQISYAFSLLGETDSAMAESRRALENDSLSMIAIGLGAMVRQQNGFVSEALALAKRAPPAMTNSAYVVAKSGDSTAAREMIRSIESTVPRPAVGNTRIAFLYLGLGDTASALSALERATDAREIWPTQSGAFDPMLDPVRKSARFQELLRRVNLDRSPANTGFVLPAKSPASKR